MTGDSWSSGLARPLFDSNSGKADGRVDLVVCVFFVSYVIAAQVIASADSIRLTDMHLDRTRVCLGFYGGCARLLNEKKSCAGWKLLENCANHGRKLLANMPCCILLRLRWS